MWNHNSADEGRGSSCTNKRRSRLMALLPAWAKQGNTQPLSLMFSDSEPSAPPTPMGPSTPASPPARSASSSAHKAAAADNRPSLSKVYWAQDKPSSTPHKAQPCRPAQSSPRATARPKTSSASAGAAPRPAATRQAGHMSSRSSSSGGATAGTGASVYERRPNRQREPPRVPIGGGCGRGTAECEPEGTAGRSGGVFALEQKLAAMESKVAMLFDDILTGVEALTGHFPAGEGHSYTPRNAEQPHAGTCARGRDAGKADENATGDTMRS